MGKDYFTFSEYMQKGGAITATMEDYLEMVFRLSHEKGYTRIRDLSAALNVQPPAATKMVQRMASMKLVKYQKYGILEMDEEGKRLGEALLKRHKVVEMFLKELGVDDSELLEETEKIEHTLNPDTVKRISDFVEFMKINKEFSYQYSQFRDEKTNK